MLINFIVLSLFFSQKQLYLSFVRSQLLYYCQLWRPQLSKDIFTLECVNCRATKYIFKQLQVAIQRETWAVTSPTNHVYLWIEQFNLFVKPLTAFMDHFDIRSHIQFVGNPTRSGISSKLVHVKALQSSHHHFYFNRIVRLWNHLPEIDTSFSINMHNRKPINCSYIYQIIFFYQLYNSETIQTI